MAGPELKAKLTMDDSAFQAGVRRAQNTAASAGKSMAGAFAGIGAGLAGALSVGAIASFSKGVMSMAGDLEDQAAAADVSVESLQRFQHAMVLGGASSDAFTKSVFKIREATESAAGGNEKMVKAFAALGISISEVESLAPDEITLRFADALANAADKTATINALTDIYGAKLAQKLIPSLREGAAAFKAAGESAEIMSAEIARQLASTEDVIDTFWLSVKKKYGAGMSAAISQAEEEGKQSNFFTRSVIGAGIAGLFTGPAIGAGPGRAGGNVAQKQAEKAAADAAKLSAKEISFAKATAAAQERIEKESRDRYAKAQADKEKRTQYDASGSLRGMLGMDKDADSILAEQDEMAREARANRLRTRTGRGSAGRGGGSSMIFADEAKRGAGWGRLAAFDNFKEPLIQGSSSIQGAKGGLVSGMASERERARKKAEEDAKKNESQDPIIRAINEPAWVVKK